MISILAEVSSTEIGVFVGCLIVVLGLALVIKQLLTREPPLHREFASKAELDALSARVDALSHEIHSDFEALDRKRSISVAGLHEKIEQRTAALNQRIDELPDRMIERLIQAQQLNARAATK